jgi:ketosteroid isomerase-like protein
MKGVRLAGTSDIRELKVLGGWAYIRNCIEITITPPDSAVMRRRGYTLSILRKQSNGKWVLWRDANLVI